MKEEREKLKEIFKSRSILKGKFNLASGKESDYYIDARLTTLDAEGTSLIGKILLNEILRDPEISAVGGPTMGADPIVGSIITQSWSENKPLSGFLVRKQTKEHGTTKLIEGNLKKDDKVAVVEDVVTTSGSVLKAIDAIETFGADIKKVLVVVDREEGAAKIFKERGYEFYSIYKVSELL